MINYKSPLFILFSSVCLLFSIFEISKGFSSVSLSGYFHFVYFFMVFFLTYVLSKRFFNLFEFKKFSFGNLTGFLFFVFLGVALLVCCFTFFLFFKLLVSGGFSSVLDYRHAFSSEENNSSIGAGFSFPFLLAASYISKYKNKLSLFNIFMFLSFVVAVISTTKIFILIFLFFVFHMYNLKFFKLILFALIAFLLFAMSHLVIGKFSSSPDDGLFLAIINTFFVYFSGGFAAYQKILDGYIVLDYNIMFIGLQPLAFLVPNYFLPSTAILPWVDVGIWETNLYTAFGYWYSFFGESHSVVMGFILGLFYGFVFSSNNFSKLLDFYRPFLLFSMFFIIFGDMFIVAFTMHIIYLFLSLIVCSMKN